MTNKPTITQEEFDKKVEECVSNPLYALCVRVSSEEELVEYIESELKEQYDIK